jgi:hypothetical protein
MRGRELWLGDVASSSHDAFSDRPDHSPGLPGNGGGHGSATYQAQARLQGAKGETLWKAECSTLPGPIAYSKADEATLTRRLQATFDKLAGEGAGDLTRKMTAAIGPYRSNDPSP